MPLNTMVNFVAVACGGALGACARYTLYLLASGADSRLPIGTVAANLSGAFLAGALFTALHAKGLGNSPIYLLLVTGFLGGFTTLSAFSLETLKLIESGAVAVAILNVLITVVGALLAVALGSWIVRLAL